MKREWNESEKKQKSDERYKIRLNPDPVLRLFPDQDLTEAALQSRGEREDWGDCQRERGRVMGGGTPPPYPLECNNWIVDYEILMK